eukprot:Selendium_serpulae@DN11183_c0_g1_i1.p2
MGDYASSSFFFKSAGVQGPLASGKNMDNVTPLSNMTSSGLQSGARGGRGRRLDENDGQEDGRDINGRISVERRSIRKDGEGVDMTNPMIIDIECMIGIKTTAIMTRGTTRWLPRKWETDLLSEV